MPEGNVENFASLVMGMNRFLTRLGSVKPFSEGVGVSEWSALSAIASQPGINNKLLSKALGVTGQRVNQLVKSLSAAGLITVSESPADARIKNILITRAGEMQLKRISDALGPAVDAAFKNREKALAGVSRVVSKNLMRLVASK